MVSDCLIRPKPVIPPMSVIANPQGEAMTDMYIIYVREFPYVRDAMKVFRELSKPEFDVRKA
ncbi:MAG: hypothetical protein LBD80_01450 [Tannerella sp.]|nr:hypothetical protein [Tannerella sp.]